MLCQINQFSFDDTRVASASELGRITATGHALSVRRSVPPQVMAFSLTTTAVFFLFFGTLFVFGFGIDIDQKSLAGREADESEPPQPNSEPDTKPPADSRQAQSAAEPTAQSAQPAAQRGRPPSSGAGIGDSASRT